MYAIRSYYDNVRIVTKGENTLYVSVFEQTQDGTVNINYLVPQQGKSLDIQSVKLLGYDGKEINWKSTSKELSIEIPADVELKHALVFKIEANGFNNADVQAVEKLFDRKEALTEWFQNQNKTVLDSKFQSVTCNTRDVAWAVQNNNELIEIKDGLEFELGLKAQDVGASSGGVVCVDLEGSVYLHTFYPLEWVDFPEGKGRITIKSNDGKEWIKLPGIKASRCDITATGTIWVTDANGVIHYYNDLIWKSLDKKAEDIACGGGWVGLTAAICNGQLERFDGTHWTNLGGKDLVAVDISNTEEVIVALDKEGNVSLYDLMGSAHLDFEEKYQDVSCGLAVGAEQLVLVKK